MKITMKVVVAALLGTSTLLHAEGIEWSGFGSLYYSQAFNNQFLVDQHENNKPDYTSKSLLGFNVGARISEDMTVASQIVMAGSDAQSTNFNMYAQWVYLNYRINDGLFFKIGRQLWPVQISSEYQRVHQLIPQSNIPYTSYGLLPFVSFDGASLNKTLETSIGSLSFGAYIGNPKLNTTPPSSVTFNETSLIGTRVTLDGSGWRLHATFNRVFSSVSVDASSYTTSTGNTTSRTTGNAKTHSNIYSFGFRYDKNNLVSWGDFIYANATDNSHLILTNSSSGIISNKKLFDKSYGGYVLLGYRFGKFLPSITFAKGTTKLGLPTDPVTNAKYEGRTTSYILGTAYQLNDQATAKIEYLRTYIPSAGEGWYDVSQASANTETHGDAVKAGIDFIF